MPAVTTALAGQSVRKLPLVIAHSPLGRAEGAEQVEIDDEAVYRLGVGILRAPVASWQSGYVRHDPDALSRELLRLYREKSHTRVYGEEG